MAKKELIKKDFLKIDRSETVSRLIGDFIKTGAKAILVFDKKRYAGVSDRDLLIKTKLNPSKMKVNRLVKHVPILTGKEEIEEIARLIFTSETYILPVIEKDKVIGIVNSIDLINQLKGTEDAKRKIKEIMTLKPILVKENDRVGKAIEIMKEDKVSRIPIVDNKGELLNITSLTDILNLYTLRQQGKSETRGRGTLTRSGARTIRAYKDRTDLNSYPIKNLASPTIITASPDDSVSDIINLMNEFNISSIVLVEYKKPVGIVTVRDLLRLLLKDQVTF